MKRFLKRTALVLVLLVVAGWAYVLIVNRNTPDMTGRQKFLKAVYPVFMWLTGKTDKNSVILANSKQQKPAVPFYSLKLTLNNGQELDFSTLKGKKVLLVNTASNCGYTNQYAELQQLYEGFKDKLVVIGFPANDFKEQEKGTDQEIAQFCKINFGVSFPLASKGVVLKQDGQQPVFQWLTDAAKNGWNSKGPSWNFSKYLVDENGVLQYYFDPSVSPTGTAVEGAVLK